MKATTSVFEIKINRKWSKVRATSIMNLASWCDDNNIKEWRMCGMMSISELEESQELIVVR